MKSWARVWAVLKLAGPAAVATAAIIISILSLLGQSTANRDLQQTNAETRQANAAAATVRQRQIAQQVSYLQSALPYQPFTSLQVENFANTPVYNVTFQVEATISTGRIGVKYDSKDYFAALVGGKGYMTKVFTLWLGNIPACSLGTINIVSSATAVMLKKTGLTAGQIKGIPIAVSATSMSFADSNGFAWRYSGIGNLQQLESLPMNTYTPDGYLQVTYRAATSCV